MTTTKDFLFELLTEELPPKNLRKLSGALENNIITKLKEQQINYKSIKTFATPRRMALLISGLSEQQPVQLIEKLGPALPAAFDAKGKPTKACIGFAKSCDTTPEKLTTTKTAKGERIVFRKKNPGEKTSELLPKIIEESLCALPIARPMRWNDHKIEFVRPVHSVIMLFGNKIIPAEILGIKASNTTFGHRFLSTGQIKITAPNNYEKLLNKNFVIADFNKRKKEIQNQIKKLESKIKGSAVINDDLLDEVTALVEWPVGLLATFPKQFLNVTLKITLE